MRHSQRPPLPLNDRRHENRQKYLLLKGTGRKRENHNPCSTAFPATRYAFNRKGTNKDRQWHRLQGKPRTHSPELSKFGNLGVPRQSSGVTIGLSYNASSPPSGHDLFLTFSQGSLDEMLSDLIESRPTRQSALLTAGDRPVASGI